MALPSNILKSTHASTEMELSYHIASIKCMMGAGPFALPGVLPPL
jgi:hypothetical protein